MALIKSIVASSLTYSHIVPSGSSSNRISFTVALKKITTPDCLLHLSNQMRFHQQRQIDGHLEPLLVKLSELVNHLVKVMYIEQDQ
jgi:hypothetical protein